MRRMYSATLIVHSWLRWAAILAGIAAVVSATPRHGAGSKAGLWFTILLDVQLLVGLALYLFISPNTTAAMHDFGAAMHTPATRFFLVEHPFGMIIAIALAHVGKIRGDRGAPHAKTFLALSLLVLLASQPWPGLPYGRPLVRF
ncbi:MAG TPA: hypothetical protein VL262_02815 [Vicinamibacterales bacterium]|jgi:hypothetical protein|nr:hypothetical protein [Vicinamibacterales bacterium]